MMNPDVRRKTFRAALALKETTQAEWAAEEGITEGHLSHVLAGRRPSKVLLTKVEAYIRKTFNEVLRVGR